MKLTLKSRKAGKVTFIDTEVLGAKVTLSKTLVQKLKDAGKLKQEIETTDDMILVATTKTTNGKTWTNFYLTVKKQTEAPEDEPAPEDELPF